jgi:predicted nucleic acid-binding protein
MRSVLIDTAVVLYVVGAEHPLKGPCRRVLTEPSLEICASVEMIQEVVFHRMRVGDRVDAVRVAEQWAQACRLYPFDHEVLAVALSLIERHGNSELSSHVLSGDSRLKPSQRLGMFALSSSNHKHLPWFGSRR